MSRKPSTSTDTANTATTATPPAARTNSILLLLLLLFHRTNTATKSTTDRTATSIYITYILRCRYWLYTVTSNNNNTIATSPSYTGSSSTLRFSALYTDSVLDWYGTFYYICYISQHCMLAHPHCTVNTDYCDCYQWLVRDPTCQRSSDGALVQRNSLSSIIECL